MLNCSAKGKNMWLTGHEINKEVQSGRIKISPFSFDRMNSNSYNYSLNPKILRLIGEVIDLKKQDEYEDLIIPEEGLLLKKGECYLGCTDEIFETENYACLVTGRSSIGRKFVTNHVTAGLIDQGFRGRITLEIIVQKDTIVYPHIPFGQIFYFATQGEPFLYQGKYQDQMEPKISKILEDFPHLVINNSIINKGDFNE